MKLLFKRLLDHNLPVPTRGSEYAAGLDLRAAHDSSIPPGERKLIKTGFAVMLPPGHYGRIAPRSGLAYKNGIDVLAGVIDIDYRGDVGVILLNTSDNIFTVEVGDKIAQLIVSACAYPVSVVVSELPETGRGPGGFGSTGVKSE